MVHRKTTKELLAESFRELASSKPVDAITVQGITAHCGVFAGDILPVFQ